VSVAVSALGWVGVKITVMRQLLLATLGGNGDSRARLRPRQWSLIREAGLYLCTVDWLCLDGCVKLGDMKKQASDQSFHDRRYQERKRAEAAKKPAPKKAVSEESSRTSEAAKENSSK